MTEPLAASTTPGAFPNPLLNPALLANPYTLYALMRASNPVFRLPLPIGQEGPGVWLLTRYTEVQEVLRDARFSANRRKADLIREFAHVLPRTIIADDESAFRTMLVMDPPDHTRLRGLVNKAFTPRRVAALKPRMQEVLSGLLDAASEYAQDGVFDLIREVAEPFPAVVIAELLGVPGGDRDHFRALSNRLVTAMGRGNPAEAAPEIEQSMDGLRSYLAGVVEERRRTPRDDLISALIAARDAHDSLSERELLSTATLLLIAGYETTTNLIGNGMLALLRHPDELAKLRSRPELLASAVEECLRYDGPVQATVRVPTEDVAIAGHTILRGAVVVTSIGAANRDPAAFPEPDRFDIARDENHHLAFGFGVHFCLGASLARIEGELAFRGLLDRFARIELACDRPEPRPNPILRGYSSLPVAVSL